MRRFYDEPNPLVFSILLFLLLVHTATQENQYRGLGGQTNASNNNSSTNNEMSSGLASSTTGNNNFILFDCLPTCQCDYKIPNQRLEINCQIQSLPIYNTDVVGGAPIRDEQQLSLGDGVRTLVLRNMVLTNKSSYKSIPLLSPNTLVKLELHHVHMDAMEFLNSALFESSKNSLKHVFIFQSSTISTDIFSTGYTEKLNAFSRLENLDSLTVCDSNPSLSHVILHCLPDLKHLHVSNSSASTVYYTSFSHLNSLQSLNLSQNHITTIPNGLFDNLKSLKSLDISYNRLTHLQEDVFLGLGSLRKLDLSHNKIQYVDAEVFTHLQDLQTINLSNNEVIQFFEPYFKHNDNLRVINMSNAWVSDTFINENANRSYREMEGLISTLQVVEVLDLSDNQMMIIPETLSHVQRLTHVHLNGNPWSCTCDERWFSDWIATSNVSIGKDNSAKDTFCTPNGGAYRYPLVEYIESLRKTCLGSEITARYAFKYYAVMGKDKLLSCHSRTTAMPTITWITPSKNRITVTANYTSVHQEKKNNNNEEDDDDDGDNHELLEPSIYPDGALLLHNVEGPDYGLYLCIATYDDLNITHYVHVGMDVSIFEDVRLMSLVVGLISSFGFLFLVLLAQLIRFLLLRSGLHCIAVRTANQARRVRAFFDSMEQNKNSQLDWLRQNYNMQSKKIQDNCISQLERIRESYTNQTKNLSEFRDYSAQQLTTMRDQYQDQIRKVASYSAHRLGKVRENYVFNRNRVGKFSSHQLIRLREAYKWQAQTLNKILENLPQGLNLDSCRGVGACVDEDSEDFIGHSSTRSSVRLQSSSGEEHVSVGGGGEDKHNEHISLLIPPEFLASYLIPPIPNFNLDEQVTLMVDVSNSRRDLDKLLVHKKGSAYDREQNGHCSKTCDVECHSNLPFADDDV